MIYVFSYLGQDPGAVASQACPEPPKRMLWFALGLVGGLVLAIPAVAR